jgi:hypothetical protein
LWRLTINNARFISGIPILLHLGKGNDELYHLLDFRRPKPWIQGEQNRP